MSDTNTTTTAATRESVADRQWINLQAEECDAEEATGFRYVWKRTNKAYVWQSKLPAGDPATMLAVFGGLTKAGNIANTLTKGPKGDPDADVIQGISDWFDTLDEGTWAADRVGGGIRVNPEILARAIAHVKGERHDDAHLPYLNKITSKVKVKDNSDKTGKREILYSTWAMRNKDVEKRYNESLPQHSAAPAATDL